MIALQYSALATGSAKGHWIDRCSSYVQLCSQVPREQLAEVRLAAFWRSLEKVACTCAHVMWREMEKHLARISEIAQRTQIILGDFTLLPRRYGMPRFMYQRRFEVE